MRNEAAMKRRFRLIWLLCAFIWIACERESSLPGTYEAFDNGGEPAQLVLRLDADGRGAWSLGDEYVEIRWKVRGGNIVMHTKSGGVFEGMVDRDRGPQITITLASIGSYKLKKRLS
jgi:hypothetical protein